MMKELKPGQEELARMDYLEKKAEDSSVAEAKLNILSGKFGEKASSIYRDNYTDIMELVEDNNYGAAFNKLEKLEPSDY